MTKIIFIILCLEGAVLSFNVAATAALVPSIAVDFGLSQFTAGRIIWIYMFSYGIAALAYGPLARLFDTRKLKLIFFFLFSLANLIAGTSQNIHTLFVARFFMGLFGASIIPLTLILIGRHVEGKRRGRIVGVFFSFTFIASLAGLFLSGIISWRLVFLIPAAAGLILWLFIYFYFPSFRQDKTSLKFNYLTALKNSRVVSIFIYIFLISLIYHGVQQWLGVYFSTRFKFSQFLISMLITLTSLSGVFGEAIGGYAADRIGRVRTVDIGIILMISACFALIFYSPVVFLGLVMVIWGMGWTLNHAGLSTMLTDLPKEFLNEAASLNSSVRFIAGGMGTALGGIIMQRSFNLGFLLFAVFLTGLLLFAKNVLAKK